MAQCRRKGAAALLALSIGVGPLLAGEETEEVRLGIRDAVETALSADYSVERARIATLIAEQRRRETAAADDWTASLSGSASLNDDASNPASAIRTQFGKALYDPGQRAATSVKDAERRLAAVTEDDVKDWVAYEVKRHYVNLLLQHRLRGVTQEHLSTLRGLRDRMVTERPQDLNSITGLILRLESGLEKEELSIRTQEREFSYRLTKRDCGSACAPLTLTERLEEDGLSIDQGVVAATAQEYRARQARAAVTVKQRELTLATRQWYPRVGAFGYLQGDATGGDLADDAGIGLSLSLLLAPTLRSATKARVSLELRYAELTLEETLGDAAFRANIALELYLAAAQVIRPEIVAGDRNTFLETVQDYFANGKRSFNDLNIALENWTNGERQLLRDYATRQLRLFELEYRVGLSEEGIDAVFGSLRSAPGAPLPAASPTASR